MEHIIACQHINTSRDRQGIITTENLCPVGKQKIKALIGKDWNDIVFENENCRECCNAEFSCSNVFLHQKEKCHFETVGLT